MKRTKVIDALKSTAYGSDINVKGWVRTKRGGKGIFFIALNDGSTIKNVQIVGDEANFEEETLKRVTTGACLSVVGKLVESPAAGQASEIQATSIEILGDCDNTYPLQKKGASWEYLRTVAHLRPRTNTFGAILRIRHNMAMAIHTYFHEHGYFYFHTPLITASDCEGAGNMFQVTTKNLYDLKKDEQGKIIYDDDFFGEQTSLTVSGQLEGELGATALGAIYTFGPTFRAENSNTPRHLAEFWMIEPEVAFLDQEELMDLEEDFIKYCVKWALRAEGNLRSPALHRRHQDLAGGKAERQEVRVPLRVGRRPCQRARTLPRGGTLQEARHHDRLSALLQVLLHEAEPRDGRRRQHRLQGRRSTWSHHARHRCPLPVYWRNHWRLRS